MILVTAATGHLGTLVVAQLLEHVPASEIAVAVRNPEKAAHFAARGVQVRAADYSKPDGLDAALAGADKVLLISGSEVGQRVAQHQAVIDAAARSGVKHLVYTGVLHAARTTMKLAAEHQATEKNIVASGLPYTFLRNGWYTENYTERVQQAIEQGTVYGATGGGKVAVAARADFAAAAASVLTGTGHEHRAYELAGDVPITLAEYTAEVTRLSGKTVTYTDMPGAAFEAALVKAGLPGPVAAIFADCDLAIGRGELTDDSGDLRRLIGRPTTPWTETLAAALR
jgi:NAD(P)H dehydrogenase (quinone)